MCAKKLAEKYILFTAQAAICLTWHTVAAAMTLVNTYRNYRKTKTKSEKAGPEKAWG